jgi:exosortase A
MTYEKGTTDAPTRGAWLLAGGLVLANLVLLGVLFADAVVGAVRVWDASETFTHCYLILPIVGYLLWDRRAELARVRPRPQPWALLALPPLLLVALVGRAASILELEQLALVAVAQAVLLALLGWSVYRVAWFAFLYLFLLVPSGEWLVPALQDFTADFSVGALRLIGIPTLHDGIMIYIPNGSFRVAEACAGLRFLIATIAYGLLFAYLVYRSWPRRLIFVALSLIIPIIANGFRAFGIIWLAHITDNAAAVAADHLVYGWIFFALVLLILTTVGFAFREDLAERPLPAPETRAPGQPLPFAATGLVVAALIAAGPAWALFVGGGAPATQVTLPTPPVSAPWRPTDQRLDSWHAQYPAADSVLVQAYTNGDVVVQLEIAYYAYQRDGAEVVAHENRPYDDETWRRVEDITATVAPDGQPLDARGQRLQSVGRTLVTLPWYWVDGRFTTSPMRAKLLQVSAKLVSGQQSAAYVVVAAPYVDEPDQAVAAIADLIDHLGPLQPVLTMPQRSE